MNRSFRKCILTWMVTILLVIGSIAEPVLADPLSPASDHEHNDYTLAAHQDATCTEDGFNDYTCNADGCNYTYREIIPAAHTPGEPSRENEASATCTEAGHYEEVVYCTACGTELRRDQITTDQAFGHSPAAAVRENETPATCTESGGYEDVVYCETCGAELSRTPVTEPANGHVWNAGIETQAPTADEEGVRTYTCTVCNAIKTEPIPKLSTQTPDGGQTPPVVNNTTSPKLNSTAPPALKGTSEDPATSATSGTCGENGENLTWKLDAEGKLTISGKGAMANYQAIDGGTTAPWNQKRSEIKTVEIADGVTGIGSYAFSGCAQLTSVTIPASVTGIGVNAFADCKGLTTVNYAGTEDAWKQVVAGANNEALEKAAKNYAGAGKGMLRGANDAAKIGNTGYATLKDAFDAAKDGDTIVLLRDVDVTSPIMLEKSITLDLKGYTIQIDNTISGFQLQDDLILEDTSEDTSTEKTGTIKCKDGREGNCFLIKIENNASFTMNGGIIGGNEADSSCSPIEVANGTFTMNGGEISGHRVNNNGGAVYVERDGTFIMYGGEIKNNTADGSGGGVYLDVGATFTMTGGTITNNTANTAADGFGGGIEGSGAHITLYGNPNISGNDKKTSEGSTVLQNLFLSDSKITIPKEKTLGEGANIGITMGTPGVFTDGLKNGEISAFKSDDPGYKITTENGEASLNLIVYTVTFVVENGSWDDGTSDSKVVKLSRRDDEDGQPEYDPTSGDLLLCLKAEDIPSVGSKPNHGFEAGSWDVVPTTGLVISSDKIYTYTYKPNIATVIFKVVHGAWDDKQSSEDITIELQGHEGDALHLAADQIPAVGNKPADTYKAGSWDTEPSTKTEFAVGKTYTYTYTYEQKAAISYKVTFNVTNGSWDDGTKAAKTVTLSGYEGDTLYLSSGQIPSAGSKPANHYKTGSWAAPAPDTKTAITKNTSYTYNYERNTVVYSLTEGADQEYKQGSDATLTFVFKRSENDDETFSHFTGLSYNGRRLTKDKHFTAKSGSVVVELQSAFLKTLSAGDQVITARFDDGDDVDVAFKVLKADTYKVTFNVNGHGTAPATQTVISGAKATKPANPTAQGYKFGGWFTDSACTTAFSFNTAITSDITLYAKWTKTSSGQGGSGGSGGSPVNPARTGDENHPGLWILLMALAAAAILGGGIKLASSADRKQKR